MKRNVLFPLFAVLTLFAWTTVKADGPFDPGHPLEPGVYILTLNANDGAMGTLSGAGSYPQGTTVTISATPNSGYQFLQWSDGITANPRDVVIQTDTVFTAMFAITQPLRVCLGINELIIYSNPFVGDIVFKDAGGNVVLTVTPTALPQTITYPDSWTGGANYQAVFNDGDRVFFVKKE